MENNNSEYLNIPQDPLIEKNRRIVTNANDNDSQIEKEIRDESQQN